MLIGFKDDCSIRHAVCMNCSKGCYGETSYRHYSYNPWDVGLILGAVNFMNGGSGAKNIKEILIYFALGGIFFFAGISLIRTTHDRPS